MSENTVLTPIKFWAAQEKVPEGIAQLIRFRAERDEVSEEYAEDRVARRYDFFVDEKDQVWVMTDFPEEPGIWSPANKRWMDQSELEDYEVNGPDEP